MGTPEFAVKTLKSLIENDYNVVAVVTQPDKPVGRHQDTLQPSEVKKYALRVGLPVLQPAKMKNPEFISKLKSFNPDLCVVVAFRMLPELVWSIPHYGTFNVHAALLPQYRGAAPINWAVINGETETGVTTFFLDNNIDTGNIIGTKKIFIPDDVNVEYVYDKLMVLGASLALETIDLIIETLNIDNSVQSYSHLISVIAKPQPKVENINSAPKIFKDTCIIKWNQTVYNIYNFIRGLSPYPGAWANLVRRENTANTNEKLIVKIFKALKTEKPSIDKCGTFVVESKHLYVNTQDYQIELLEVQLSGKKRMPVISFLNGFKDIEDYKLV